jgi:hypothetical protein
LSEWLLFNANSAIFQLYHGKNKLIVNEMMMRSTYNTQQIPNMALHNTQQITYMAMYNTQQIPQMALYNTQQILYMAMYNTQQIS